MDPTTYTVLNGNFVSDLHDVYQEHNPGIKGDFPVLSSYILLNIQSVHCVRGLPIKIHYPCPYFS